MITSLKFCTSLNEGERKGAIVVRYHICSNEFQEAGPSTAVAAAALAQADSDKDGAWRAWSGTTAEPEQLYPTARPLSGSPRRATLQTLHLGTSIPVLLYL